MSTSQRTVNIGIIGLGTVGTGTVKTIQRHQADYLKNHGIDLQIKKACARTASRGEELGLAPEVFCTDWREVVYDPDIDIVVELIGGLHPATEIFYAAFDQKKHVVSANKALLGQCVDELARHARQAGVQIRCEAAAAGGIPIVSALEHDLTANRILAIAGIVNGTTNYILSRMEKDHLEFDEALAEAQAAGFAEADPSADIDGTDAASKIAILASIGFKTRVRTEDVYTSGIRQITAQDIAIAERLGYTIKLLACAREIQGRLDVRVHPALIPTTHQLASVQDAMNGIVTVGDAVGETMFYGAGAGALPTASAVVGDILALAAPLSAGLSTLPEAEPFERKMEIQPIDDLKSCYIARLVVEDHVGALAVAAQAFANYNISISQVLQVSDTDNDTCQVVFVTHQALEGDMRKALASLQCSSEIHEVASALRIEDLSEWTA